MVFRLLADAVVILHLGFIVFVAAGGLLAWRWRRLVWLHLAAVAWGVGIVTVGYRCPLTALEKALRGAAGDGYGGGFVDRYVENVVYPEAFTPVLRALAAVMIVVAYAGLAVRARGARRRSPALAACSCVDT